MQRQIPASVLQVRDNIVMLLKLVNVPDLFAQLKQLKKEVFLWCEDIHYPKLLTVCLFFIDHEEAKTHQSKLALKKLLNKIRSQKEEWKSKSEKETQSEIETIESGTIASEERPLGGLKLNCEQQNNAVCEAKGTSYILA